MDGGAWWAAVHGVAKSQTRLSDFTFTFQFHALEKEMATHSSILAWRIPGTGEPGRLPSMGSHRVGHDWSDLAVAAGGFSAICSRVTHIAAPIWWIYCTWTFFFFTLFYFTILYWFRPTLTWIHHGCTCVPKHEPPPTSLPITSLWVIPMHQPQACCILRRTLFQLQQSLRTFLLCVKTK